tara:strand:- start:7846 stop:9105 length:1260 start_codon:yes stop_codon:yes gene_type:complete
MIKSFDSKNILITYFLGIFIFGALNKIFTAQNSSYFDEIFILITVPFALYFLIRNIFNFKLAIIFLILHIAVYLISSLQTIYDGRITTQLTLLSLFLEFKYFLLFLFLALSIQKSKISFESLHKALSNLFIYLTILNVPFVFFDILISDYSILGFPLQSNNFLNINAAQGLFVHKFYLALCSVLSVIFCCINYLVTNSKKYLTLFLLSLLILFLSYSLKELAIGFFCLALIIYQKLRNHRIFSLIIFVATILIIPLSLIFFLGERSYYFTDITVRGLFYSSSVDIANNYFPFGAGTGKFGSTVASDYAYSELYFQYGIAYIYGGTTTFGQYLTDVGYAKYLGESGWIGIAFLLFAFLTPIFSAYEKSHLFSLKFLTILLLGLLIITNNFASTIQNSDFGSMLVALYFAIYSSTFQPHEK